MRHLYLTCFHATFLQQWYLCICIRLSFWLKVIKASMYSILFERTLLISTMYFSLFGWFVVEGASTSCYKLQSDLFIPPKWRSPNKPWKGPPTWVCCWGHSPQKNYHIPWKLVVGRWTFQEAASKAAAGETAQLLSERTELQQRLRKTRDLGKGGPGGEPWGRGTWVGQLVGVWGWVDLLFDLGIVDLCRGKCFVKVREVGFGGFCGFGIAGNRIYWIWVGKNGSGLKMYFLLKMGIC